LGRDTPNPDQPALFVALLVVIVPVPERLQEIVNRLIRQGVTDRLADVAGVAEVQAAPNEGFFDLIGRLGKAEWQYLFSLRAQLPTPTR
jgi:hypothetical protein